MSLPNGCNQERIDEYGRIIKERKVLQEEVREQEKIITTKQRHILGLHLKMLDLDRQQEMLLGK